MNKSEEAKFSLTGTSEFTDRTDQIITGAEELTLMQEFIAEKIMLIDSDGGKTSEVDKVFKLALKEFKNNLVQIYSAATKNNGIEACNIRYKDLISIFNQAMETVCQRERKESETENFPITLGVNAFRLVLIYYFFYKKSAKIGFFKNEKNTQTKKMFFDYSFSCFR